MLWDETDHFFYLLNKQFLLSERHWNLVNIAFIVAKLGNICFGRKICVWEAKMFLTPGKNIFFFVSEQHCLLPFPQHMFPVQLNWETFASAAMFPQQCF